MIYTSIEGLKCISNIDLTEDNVFEIKPGQDHLVIIKEVSAKFNAKYTKRRKVLYKNDVILKKAIEEGEKNKVKLFGVPYPKIEWYSGFFGNQYAIVYINNHDSQTFKVFIKFDEMNNFHMSENDDKNGCWLFTLVPGQKVIKRLDPISPFKRVRYKGMSKKIFLIDPNKPNEYSLKELMTPELLNNQELTDITTSRGKMMIYGKLAKKYAIWYYYNFNSFYAFVFSNPMSDYTFCAKIKFTLENYSLDLSKEDSEDTWNIKLSPNQTLVKTIKLLNPDLKGSWSNSTSKQFVKI